MGGVLSRGFAQTALILSLSVWVSGCGESGSPTTSTPPAANPFSVFDGHWAGTTSEGLVTTFAVLNGLVTDITVSYSSANGCVGVKTLTNLNLPIQKTSGRGFGDYVSFAYISGGLEPNFLQVVGTFSSNRSAWGNNMYVDCGVSLGAPNYVVNNWTASRQ
jgi:hypothetical protein